jgi:hypothetical protein
MDQPIVIEVAVSQSETVNDALIECVKACGGSKVVGLALWPAKGVEAAQRNLLACLNPDRNEKLSPDETLHIMRMARERGCHEGMQYMASFLSYSMPTPVEPRDELAELLRQHIEATRETQKRQERIDRALQALGAPALKAVA